MAAEMQPIEVYEAAKDSAFIIVAFYRGSWCPFCMGWFKEWLRIENFATQLRTLNAAFLLVSSETQEEVDCYMGKLGMDSVDARVLGIGDPEHTLATKLRTDGVLNVALTGAPGPYKSHGSTYPHGMTQPACLVLETGTPDEILYSWAIVPKVTNLMGATDRPAPLKIWEYVMNARKADAKDMKPPKGKTMRYIGAHFRKN